MTGAALVLAAAAGAVAAPPTLQVCLRPLWEAPCAVAPLPVEGTVTGGGLSGEARLQWSIDGHPLQTRTVTLDQVGPVRVLLLLEPRRPRHRVALEASQGNVLGRAIMDIVDQACPFDVRTEFIVAKEGRALVGTLRNLGPSPSGPLVVRWLINGVRMFASSLESLPPGAGYETVVPWRDLPRGRLRIALAVEVSSGDLDPRDDVFEIALTIP